MCDDILFHRDGHAGIVTLNRPKALNALTHEMVRALTARLKAWSEDDAIRLVIMTAAGEKAFCAGGDIRKVHDMGRAGDPEQNLFFAEEYRLNAYLKRYPKPIVSLLDGIVMGGGVGLSVHGSHRVGGERLTFAMPETSIGFFPDVGGSYILSRMPARTGVYAALTSARLKLADAYWTGIVTHPVRSSDMAQIRSALCEADDVDAVLSRFTIDPGPAPLSAHAKTIERVFSHAAVSEIIKALSTETGAAQDFCASALEAMTSKSPMSLAISLKEIRRGEALELDECMVMEYRILTRILQGSDFYEGVRAVLIDKDNAPKWSPATLEEVSADALEAHFHEPAGGDLDLTI